MTDGGIPQMRKLQINISGVPFVLCCLCSCLSAELAVSVMGCEFILP